MGGVVIFLKINKVIGTFDKNLLVNIMNLI